MFSAIFLLVILKWHGAFLLLNSYALEPLTRKRETREKVEFYKLPCHVFALRPDVGPPPVHGNGVDLLRNKLQELAAGKTRDVRDRLLLVRRSILQLRENLLGLPESGTSLHEERPNFVERWRLLDLTPEVGTDLHRWRIPRRSPSDEPSAQTHSCK